MSNRRAGSWLAPPRTARTIAGITKSAASTASAKTNTDPMTHLGVRAEAERPVSRPAEREQLHARALPRSSDTGVEAAGRPAVSPPISRPATHGRKAARESGRAIPTATRPPRPTRSHTAKPPGRRPRNRAPSRSAETGGEHDSSLNSTYVEIEVNENASTSQCEPRIREPRSGKRRGRRELKRIAGRGPGSSPDASHAALLRAYFLQPGNLKETIRVLQAPSNGRSPAPRYSWAYQKVQSSTGSTVRSL